MAGGFDVYDFLILMFLLLAALLSEPLQIFYNLFFEVCDKCGMKVSSCRVQIDDARVMECENCHRTGLVLFDDEDSLIHSEWISCPVCGGVKRYCSGCYDSLKNT